MLCFLAITCLGSKIRFWESILMINDFSFHFFSQRGENRYVTYWEFQINSYTSTTIPLPPEKVGYAVKFI